MPLSKLSLERGDPETGNSHCTSYSTKIPVNTSFGHCKHAKIRDRVFFPIDKSNKNFKTRKEAPHHPSVKVPRSVHLCLPYT